MNISMILGRINDASQDLKHRSLYKPLELELQADGGLKTIQNSFNLDNLDFEEFDKRKTFDLLKIDFSKANVGFWNEKNDRRQAKKSQQNKNNQDIKNPLHQDIQNPLHQDIQNPLHNGLLSGLLHQVEQKTENKIKIMICVAMYSEPLPQLQKSIQGIIGSLDDFVNHGYASHEIGVTVFFDGIENIHNKLDQNGTHYHDNIIPYFKSHIDDLYCVQENKSLEHQYWEYKKHKKYVHDYCQSNILYMRKNRELLLRKYQKHKESLLKIMKHLKEQFLPQDEFIESNIIDAMKHQYKLSKKYVDARANSAWVYQTREIHSKSGGFMPIFYVFKFRNGSKLSSHLWFFKGFCKELNPVHCVLMDCGAQPAKRSIFKLIMSLESDDKVGGVCGNMRIEEEQESDKTDQPMDFITRILNQYIFSIQKCQSCEYDIGHILDKQFESSLNYIHVLPGAFSAYRYEAFTKKYKNPNIPQINNSNSGDGPNDNSDILQLYLRQIINSNYEYQDIQEANMFLAEDRVLCQLLFCNNYYLRYIPDALVQVDACKTLTDLLFQRRRWINGSWFALNYVVDTFQDSLEKSGQGGYAKACFIFSIVNARIQQLGQYFFQTFQIIWLYMILNFAIKTDNEYSDQIIKSGIIALYVFLILVLIFLSITYNPQLINAIKNNKEKESIRNYYFSKFYGISTILGLISLGTLGYTIYILIDQIFINSTLTDFVDKPDVPQSYYFLLILISFGMNALPFLLCFLFCVSRANVLSIIVNMIHYFYYQPTYTHLFLIYSFCRIDDLSWGTKGLTIDTEKQNISSDKTYYKFKFVAQWLFLNSLASTIILLLFQLQVFLLAQFLILIISVVLTVLSLIKGFFAVIYHFKFNGYKKIRDRKCQNLIFANNNDKANNDTNGNANIGKAAQRSQKMNQDLENCFAPRANH